MNSISNSMASNKNYLRILRMRENLEKQVLREMRQSQLKFWIKKILSSNSINWIQISEIQI
jgi:hypothetical protein